MARCDVEGCDWYGTKAGKPIHMARMHDIHPVHEDTTGFEPVLNRSTSEPDRLMEPIVSRWSP